MDKSIDDQMREALIELSALQTILADLKAQYLATSRIHVFHRAKANKLYRTWKTKYIASIAKYMHLQHESLLAESCELRFDQIIRENGFDI